MRKFLGLAGLVVLLAVGSACSGSSASDGGGGGSSPPIVTYPTYVTPTTNDSVLRALCLEGMGYIMDGLDSISEGAALLAYVPAADAREFLATAHEFVTVSKVTISQCSSLDPAGAAEALSLLDELDSAISSAESLL